VAAGVVVLVAGLCWCGVGHADILLLFYCELLLSCGVVDAPHVVCCLLVVMVGYLTGACLCSFQKAIKKIKFLEFCQKPRMPNTKNAMSKVRLSMTSILLASRSPFYSRLLFGLVIAVWGTR